MADGPYSRVYWSILEDEEWESVRSSPAALGSWLLLLIQADAMWPAPALIPARIDRRTYNRLTSAGIVESLPHGRYRIRGMAQERAKRSERARNAAEARWSGTASALQVHSERIALAMPSKDETRRDETRTTARAREDASALQEHGSDPWAEPEGEALTWLSKHGCFIRPGNGYHQKLVLAVERHGVNAMIGMLDRLAEAGVLEGDTKGFLFGAIDALDARTRPKTADLERAERADEQRAVHERGIAATQEYLRRLREVGQ